MKTNYLKMNLMKINSNKIYNQRNVAKNVEKNVVKNVVKNVENQCLKVFLFRNKIFNSH